MSATEDSSSNVEDENTRINPVGGSQDPEIRSEGNVLTLDSTNTKNNGDRLLNTSEPAILSLEGTNKDSGDATVQILSRESETSDKMESEDICNSDAGKGSGDYSAKAKLSDAIRQKVDNIDENKEVTLNTDVIAEKEDSNDGFLDKGDDVDLEKDNDEDQGDDLDDDITLRWDDDDGSSQPLGVDNENSETKNDEILDEEKLLEESSDVIIQESAAKSSDINLDRDNSNDEADGIVLSTDKNIKNITVEESVDSPKGDTHIETSDGKNIDNILEDELLEEPDPETEIHPEMDIPSKNAEEDINDLESELLEESNIEIDQDKEVPAEKSMDKDIEERIEDEISEINKISKDSTVKENLDSIEEDILLTESESNTEIEATVFTIKSFTDAILNPDSEDVALEDNLLTDSESNLESSEIIPETDFSVNKDLEDSEDALLEAKILEDIKKAEDMLENDIAMDVDDDTEGELLKGDESHDESSTPMDVDNTDQSIENSAKVQEEIDQPINDESELTKAGLESPLNQQTVKANLSKAITLDENATNNTEKDQLDDIQAISETNIDQACQEQAETELIEQQGETETTVKPIDEQPKADDNKKDQPIDDSNDMEQSSSTPVHIQTPIDSDKPKTQIDDVGKPLPEKENDNPKIEDEIKSENPEEIIETANLDQTTDISANNASICLEDSPVHIKIKHGLHKPDVMLEIPTQELKDMDDTELSFNLDQSEIIDGNNDVDTNADDIVYENAVSQEPIVTDTAVSQESMLTDTAVSQKAIVIDTSDNQEVKLTDTTGNQGAKVTDTTVSQDAKVTNIAVSQESAVTDTTVRQEVKLTDTAVSLEAAVTDTTVSQEPAVTDTTVSQEVKVTDATGRQEAKVTDIAVSQEAKVTDTAVSQEAAVTDAPGRQEAIETDTTVSQEAAVSDTTGRQEAKVTDTAVSQEVAVTDTAVRREAIVTETAVNEVEKDVVESTDDVKDKDAVVPETIEESMERMFADDEPAQELVEATKSQTQVPEEQPSTSFTTMTPDTSDEVPEVSDSLGLLAESSGRIMEDDEEPDDDDDGDDDDDFDQDESSNQISAEQSEDSNPPVLESETAEQQVEKEIETPDPKDDQFQFLVDSVDNSEDKADKMDIEEFGTVELQAESINDEETKTAVDALLRDGAPDEQEEEPEDNADQMDIETVKLSDTSDNEGETPTAVEETAVEPDKEEKQANQSPSKSNQSPSKTNQSPSKQSPSKMKKLEITTQEASSVVNYVDLEESSSEDDIQEVEKQPEEETAAEKPTSPESQDVTNVNIPTGIEIMCTSGGSTSEIVTKEKEVVISGVPKPPPHKLARLNTSEVSIKTASNTEPLVIPETKINDSAQTSQSKPKMGLEIFSLDSDDEDSSAKEKPGTSPHKMTALELEKARETSKCINYCCTNGNKVPYRVAEPSVVAYYDAGRKRRSMVCLPCADVVANRTKNLIQGIKDLTPLLDLEMDKLSQDLVEISDSESEDEDMTPEEPKESIGEEGAKFVEDNLAKFLNDTWKKYDMDARLKETQIMLDDEIEKLEQDSKEIDAMLNECQVATDKLRCDLYASFECRREELPPLVLYDTPDIKLVGLEMDQTTDTPATPIETTETRLAKRRLSSSSEVPAKRPAIPLGYTPLDPQTTPKDPKIAIPLPDGKLEDDKDISVVKLSAEAAPADLPPPGEISRPPLRVNMLVYAMKNAFGPWLRGRVLEIQPKNPNGGTPFSLCRVKFDHKRQANGKVLAARCIAYAEPADVRMTIGTRLIALFKDSNKRESYYSGVVAEIPNPVNNYRYLVFFDDGYAQYVQHQHTRLVCESSPLVWEEVHPFSREFVREYLLAYPERPMVRLHEGQHLKTEWNGKWWSSRVTKVDASLAQVMFVGDGRREWIYRGSTRLAPLYLELRAAERHRPRPMPRSKAQPRLNMPYVEYTRSDEQEASKQAEAQTQQQQQNEEIRRQRAVARKSTSAAPAPAPPAPAPALDTVTSRVVYYTPKNAVKPYKMTTHKCGPKCKRSDVLSLKELRTYNPLAKPLLSGWERQIVRFKGHKEVMYRAPCGRRLRSVRELHRYLRAVACDLPVDLFDFHPATHCLAEFVLNKCRVGKKDLSHGKENVPVPCVNYYDDSLPEFCSYNTERTPTAGVPLNLDPEFLCGCDCIDDCQDKSKCACWKMTLEGARTIGLEGPNVGYVYKRLPEPLPSGIYECNSRCKCKHTCLNRVAQHPLQLKLQVFKTLNRGWGIRALNDVPKGSFLCVYAGNLLTDATANLDGLNEGDEYLAELDYIEVVEQMKEGYEEDIPEADKRLDKKDQAKVGEGSEEDEPTSSEDEDTASKTDKEDDDFRPGHIGVGVMEFNKRLRKREKNKKDREKAAVDEKEKENSSKDKDSNSKESNADEDCITISDDEEVREPSRFMVQAGMGANEFISKYKSVRTLFGKDEACYIMDAKVQGNIGRYLNHSCCPNVFVQNVFVDTHDPRFPWVAFFALSHIKAGTELTWNYNYDVGSVPGKVLYCHCGAPNCRGRLL